MFILFNILFNLKIILYLFYAKGEKDEWRESKDIVCCPVCTPLAKFIVIFSTFSHIPKNPFISYHTALQNYAIFQSNDESN